MLFFQTDKSTIDIIREQYIVLVNPQLDSFPIDLSLFHPTTDKTHEQRRIPTGDMIIVEIETTMFYHYGYFAGI